MERQAIIDELKKTGRKATEDEWKDEIKYLYENSDEEKPYSAYLDNVDAILDDLRNNGYILIDIEVLMQDGCTKKEAEKCLANGTIVYRDFGDFVQNLKECGVYVSDEDAMKDVNAVKYAGREYYVCYAY